MIKESYNSGENIITVVLSGDISIDEFLNWELEIVKNKYSFKKVRILLDVTHGRYLFSVKDIARIKSNIIENAEKFHSVFIAAVHVSPYGAAFSHLFTQSVQVNKFYHKTFSEVGETLNWLRLNDQLH